MEMTNNGMLCENVKQLNCKIAVAQLGARMHYAVPRIFHDAGLLVRLFTDICSIKGWPKLFHLLPSELRNSRVKRLLGRVPVGIPSKNIKAYNWLGIEFSSRLKKNRTAAQLWAADKFSELIMRDGLDHIDIIYGYYIDTYKLYKYAKNIGKKIILEQYQAPFSVETNILNKYVSHLNNDGRNWNKEYSNEIIRREIESWSIADIIICPSDFVRKGIQDVGGPVEKCIIVPYGVDLSNFDTGFNHNRSRTSSLKILFVGGVSIGKGVHYLLEAMKELEGFPVECKIVGGWQASKGLVLQNKPSNVNFVGFVPRSEIFREYEWADVFCLPSLCEGSATVTYEALAAGLPIITTENSGSLVRDGIEGYIVPIGDSKAIAEKIKLLISNQMLLINMSKAAKERSKIGSYQTYSSRLLNSLKSLCGE